MAEEYAVANSGCRTGEAASGTVQHVASVNNFFGSVASIGQVHNANFGVNYGTIAQSLYQDSPPSHNYGPAHNGLPPRLVPIADTSHTRNRRVSPPNSNCLPGTRKVAIDRIVIWALESDFEDPHEEAVVRALGGFYGKIGDEGMRGGRNWGRPQSKQPYGDARRGWDADSA